MHSRASKCLVSLPTLKRSTSRTDDGNLTVVLEVGKDCGQTTTHTCRCTKILVVTSLRPLTWSGLRWVDQGLRLPTRLGAGGVAMLKCGWGLLHDEVKPVMPKLLPKYSVSAAFPWRGTSQFFTPKIAVSVNNRIQLPSRRHRPCRSRPCPNGRAIRRAGPRPRFGRHASHRW